MSTYIIFSAFFKFGNLITISGEGAFAYTIKNPKKRAIKKYIETNFM
jgi:hypothetical protein